MSNKQLTALKKIINSSPDTTSAYQNWLADTSNEDLSTLKLADWQEVATLIDEDDNWAAERLHAWTDVDGDPEDESESEEEDG